MFFDVFWCFLLVSNLESRKKNHKFRWCRSCLFCFPLLIEEAQPFKSSEKSHALQYCQWISIGYAVNNKFLPITCGKRSMVESVDGNTWTMVVSKCHQKLHDARKRTMMFSDFYVTAQKMSVYYVHQPNFLGESLILGEKWSWDFSSDVPK